MLITLLLKKSMTKESIKKTTNMIPIIMNPVNQTSLLEVSALRPRFETCYCQCHV